LNVFKDDIALERSVLLEVGSFSADDLLECDLDSVFKFGSIGPVLVGIDLFSKGTVNGANALEVRLLSFREIKRVPSDEDIDEVRRLPGSSLG
jgi:hypothetical protein